MLFGGAFLALTDLVARTAAAPAEIPIGVVTALLGGPFFVLVLRTARRVLRVSATPAAPPIGLARRARPSRCADLQRVGLDGGARSWPAST